MHILKIILGAVFISLALGLSGELVSPALADETKSEAISEKQEVVKEGNVWITDDGMKFFTCPVMGKEELVESAPSYSDVNNVRYYHCCPACQAPFRADPQKWLSKMVLPGNISKVDSEGVKHFCDPVTHEKSMLKEKTFFADHAGKRYYFVNKNNKKKFEKSPDKYQE